MPQSTAAVNTVFAAGGAARKTQFTVKTGNTIYAGTMVAVDATGKAVAAADTAGLQVVGIALNTAAAGEAVEVKSGDCWINVPASPVGSASIGNGLRKKLCVVDDITVNLAAQTSNSIPAGIAYDFDASAGLARVAVGECER